MKSFDKNEFNSKGTSVLVKGSFENPARSFPPKGGDFSAQIPRTIFKMLFFQKKKHFSSTDPPDTQFAVLRTLLFFHENAEKC